jgi:hypothetical protein
MVLKDIPFRADFWIKTGSKRIPLETVMSQKIALKGRAFKMII